MRNSNILSISEFVGRFLLLTFLWSLHGFNLYGQELCTETEVRSEIYIQASAEKVWHHLINFSLYPNWHNYLTSVQGDLEEGKRLRCVAINADSSITKFSAFVQTLIPEKELSWGGSALFFFRASHYYRLELTDDKRILFIQGEYWKGLWGRSYGKKIYKETYTKFKEMNRRLKVLCEGQLE